MSEQTLEEKTTTRLRPSNILDQMKSDAPVFVGFSPRGPVMEPFEIKRWGQFIVKFGSMKKCGYLATAANGFFSNGGKRFTVLNLGERSEDIEDVKARFKEGLRALDSLEEVPFITAPGEHDPEIHEVILEYCKKQGFPAILDGPEELIERVVEPELEPEATESEVEVNLPETAAGDEIGEAHELDPEPDPAEEEKYVNMPSVTGDSGLVVYPWIYFKDRVMGNFYIPPSGHIAGILCKLFNSGERPEFSTIQGTILLKYKFIPEEILEYTPRGISFLRYPTKHPGLMLNE